MSKILKHFVDDLEIEYSHHPRIFWIVFSLIGFLFIIIQSYMALPRSLNDLLMDSLLPVLVVVSFIFILLKPKNRNLLIGGVFYLVLTFVTYFVDVIPKEYGTFFFLYGAWLIIDWYNYYRFKKSIFSEIIKGNYYFAFGVFLATFIFGLITEYVNLPFLIWEYSIPLPSLTIFGIPALIAAFGWLPWTLSILAIFYHFLLLKPKKFRK